MLTREENELLCRVGPGTPMGNMMRRYWLPAALSDELEADGAPKLVRMLGERFVAFRDTHGRAGVLDENCPHRGASLLLARNEECGLRCLYHGWKIDVEGRVLETPPEPDEHNFKDKVRAPAYPVYEAGGLVWVYLGPPGSEPPRMDFEFVNVPESHRLWLKMREECNWAQGVEGVLDNAHISWLHKDAIRPAAGVDTTVFTATGQQRRPSEDVKPRMEAQNTAYGFRYGAIRKPTVDPETSKYVRVALFVAPVYTIFPAPAGWGNIQVYVAIDDEHAMLYYVRWKYDAPLTPAERETQFRQTGMRPGVDVDPAREWQKTANPSNLWMQDRAAMQRGDHYTGIYGVNIEDMAAQESMGAIFDRTKEHLGTSDVAVIRMRHLLIDGVRRFATGEPPLGLARPVDYGKLRAQEGIIPIDTPWQTLGAFAGESKSAESEVLR
jgi:phthalate 4,5-dioxygenase oxygenase subunit